MIKNIAILLATAAVTLGAVGGYRSHNITEFKTYLDKGGCVAVPDYNPTKTHPGHPAGKMFSNLYACPPDGYLVGIPKIF